MTTMSETLWLRGQAAQRDMNHLASYGAAFFGTAALQVLTLGVTAPRSFWTAMARAAASGPKPRHRAAPSVVEPAPHLPEVAVSEIAPVAQSPAPATPSPHLLDEPRGGAPDDLTALSGVGAKLASALNEFGIYHFDQLATLDEAGIAWLDAQQKGFRMICGRYDLVGQARARL